jgi:hypothetical protein
MAHRIRGTVADWKEHGVGNGEQHVTFEMSLEKWLLLRRNATLEGLVITKVEGRAILDVQLALPHYDRRVRSYFRGAGPLWVEGDAE